MAQSQSVKAFNLKDSIDINAWQVKKFRLLTLFHVREREN